MEEFEYMNKWQCEKKKKKKKCKNRRIQKSESVRILECKNESM